MQLNRSGKVRLSGCQWSNEGVRKVLLREIRNYPHFRRGTPETVVIAVGVRHNRELTDALKNSDLEIHTIGDAVEPRKVLEAIWEGFEVGNGI
jgi:soluble P-type ATPase